MGHAEHSFAIDRGPARDGAMRCALCADARPGVDHGWCAATGCLLCDGCCASLLDLEPRVLFAAVTNSSRILTADILVAACSACDRATARLAEGESGDTGEPTYC